MASRIIVPLDRSDVAECALPFARALAARDGVPIILLSVLRTDASFPDPPPDEIRGEVGESHREVGDRTFSASLPIGLNPGAAEPGPERFDKAASAASDVEQYLSRIRETISEAEVQTKVAYGDPVDHIVRAGEAHADHQGDSPIVVMASHGRSGLGRALLGSVASRVATRTTCPLMLVRATNAAAPAVDEIRFDRVLIALDGSANSEAALDAIRYIPGHAGAAIHLVRAIEPERGWVAGELLERDPEGRTHRDRAEDYLSTISDRLSVRGYSVQWDVVEGSPARRINEVAVDVHADLILMATRGQTGVMGLSVGSVAQEVLNRASRPLLVVRPG